MEASIEMEFDNTDHPQAQQYKNKKSLTFVAKLSNPRVFLTESRIISIQSMHPDILRIYHTFAACILCIMHA